MDWEKSILFRVVTEGYKNSIRQRKGGDSLFLEVLMHGS